MIHDVISARYKGGYNIEIEFDDGKHGTIDFSMHQTPDTWAVPAGAGGGAGELVVRCGASVASAKRKNDGQCVIMRKGGRL